MRQWMLKITAYADRLLEDLDDLDWPESVKEMQKNWIGRSEGAELQFNVLDNDGPERDLKITVYTTRPDTIFGATYSVLAPEQVLLSSIVSNAKSQNVEEYIEMASRKSDLERTELQKEKTGVFTDCYARNPINGEAIPIWVAGYVLGSYGTGAIMAVPAHDARDQEFALKYKLPIYEGSTLMVLTAKIVASRVIECLEITANGMKKATLLGRTFPVVFPDDTGEVKPIAEAELPLTLPELDDFTPTGTGEPPLTKALSWVKTIDATSGRPA